MNIAIILLVGFIVGFIITFLQGSPGTRIPSREAQNTRSMINLVYNICTLGIIVCGLFSIATAFGLSTMMAAAATTLPTFGFVGWAWNRCWYKVTGNTAVLTQDFLRPYTIWEDSRRGDRQITCHVKYGPGLSIAKWSEDFVTRPQTELSDPLRLEYDISFTNDTGKASVTIRYRIDYRELDRYAAQGTTEKARRRNIAESLDDEVGGEIEGILSQKSVLDVIRQSRTFAANISDLYCGQAPSPTEEELGIEIIKVTFTVNMSSIRADALSARGATEESQEAIRQLQAMALEYAPIILDGAGNVMRDAAGEPIRDVKEGWRMVQEASVIHGTAAGKVKHVAVTSIGQNGGGNNNLLAGLMLRE